MTDGLYYSVAQGELDKLATAMRENSERWFPELHNNTQPGDLTIFYTLGFVGESGEVANEVKKWMRGSKGLEDLGSELADCFTYLLLLAQETGINLVTEYVKKIQLNEDRWG